MNSVKNTGNLYRFYTESDCSIHTANQNQPSNSNTSQVNPKEVNAYTNEAKSTDSQVADKQTEERQVAIVNADCILCKTSPIEVEKAHNNSILTKVLLTLRVVTTGVATIALAGSGVALLPVIAFIYSCMKGAAFGLGAIAIHGLGGFMVHPLAIGALLVVVAIGFGLISSGFFGLEYLNNLHYSSHLRANNLVQPMLGFMKNLAEKDEEFKKLLSETRITDKGIKNIVDTSAKLEDKAKQVASNLFKQIDLFNNLNKKINNKKLLNTYAESDEKNKIMIAKLNKLEEQKLEAEKKLGVVAQELLCSLINNLCENFSSDQDTQEKIKLSFLKSFYNNLDDSKLTLRNIACRYFNIPHSSEATNIISVAVDNTIANLGETLNGKEHITESNIPVNADQENLIIL